MVHGFGWNSSVQFCQVFQVQGHNFNKLLSRFHTLRGQTNKQNTIILLKAAKEKNYPSRQKWSDRRKVVVRFSSKSFQFRPCGGGEYLIHNINFIFVLIFGRGNIFIRLKYLTRLLQKKIFSQSQWYIIFVWRLP